MGLDCEKPCGVYLVESWVSTADTTWHIGSVSGSGSEAQDLETCFVLGELVQVQVGDRPGTLWLLYPTLHARRFKV